MTGVAREVGQELEIIESVIRVNERQRERMVEKIVEALDGEIDGRTIGILGYRTLPKTQLVFPINGCREPIAG